MLLYIAGPMRGIDQLNHPAFFDAEKKLIAVGHDTLNPAKLGTGEWVDVLKRDLIIMWHCDGIATLKFWKDSKGASLEVHVATEFDIPVHPVEWWVDNP